MATREATEDATAEAMWEATEVATWESTRDATWGAAWATATWYRAPVGVSVKMAAKLFKDPRAALECAHLASRMLNGGNQWSGWPAWISFFRHIARLPVDYSKWQHHEAAAMHGGPRMMHAEFCMVSDRPKTLLIDGRNRPHCENGPFCEWRDGTALFAWHGVHVPAWLIEHPERLTVALIDGERNAEVRRVMIERYGTGRYLVDSRAGEMATDEMGTLYRREQARDEPLMVVRVLNSTPEPDGTRKTYWLKVHPELRPLLGNDASGNPRFGEPQELTPRNAIASTFGLRGEEYQPGAET